MVVKMITIYAILCLLFCISATHTEKRITNPVSIVTIVWGIIIFLSNKQIYGLFAVDPYYYHMIISGILSFCFGYYVNRIGRKKRIVHFRHKHRESTVYEINYKLCYILLIVCLVFVTGRIAGYGDLIIKSGFNLSAIGHIITENDVEYKGIINAIYFLFVTPMYQPLAILFGIEIWSKKPDIKFLILSMILVVGRILITGGRIAIIQLFISAVIGMEFSDGVKKEHLVRRIKNALKKPTGMVVIVAVVASFVALSFTKTSKSFTEHFLLDFAIQPNEFSYWSRYIENQYSYGIASLYGFIHPFLYIFKNIFGVRNFGIFDTVYENIQLTFYTWIQTGTLIYSNAYASSFWYMYYDFRWIGILIGMFIWGNVSSHYFKKAKNRSNIMNVSLYIMIAMGLVYTFTDMEFYKASYVLGILYMPHLLTSEKGRINGE